MSTTLEKIEAEAERKRQRLRDQAAAQVIRESALERIRQGASTTAVHRETGIPRGTLDSWVKRYAGSVAKLRRRRKPVKL